VAEGIGAAHGAVVEVHVHDGYPVTVNNNAAAEFTLDIARELVGADKTVRLPNPVMGAEDFSFVLDRIPGTMTFLGGTHEGRNPATAPPNHSNRVTFDEDAMVTGTAMYAALALRHLAGAPA
jgi:hippurate hydrolase